MPKEEVVKKYASLIEELASNIAAGPETIYVKGEYFGYFLNKLVKGYAAALDASLSSFNSTLFNEAKKKSITQLTDKLQVFVNTGDPLQAADELNYVVNEVYRQVVGHLDTQVTSAVALYFLGIVETVKNNLRDSKFDNPASVALRATTLRRYSLAVGVLGQLTCTLACRISECCNE
jgi:flagellar biosynthesis/type III secretory pathway protein FliH